jgi:methylenetetrahydrofolate reductase (NADPH)
MDAGGPGRDNFTMNIRDILKAHRPTFSFEFFPPKDAQGFEELFVNIASLQKLAPSFVSVTYGAGGSTREKTHDLVVRIQRETNLTAVAHLTCVCHCADDLAGVLDRYAANNVNNILALGGDPPRGLADFDRSKDAFRYAADLVRFIRSRPTSKDFGIGVAGFPEGHPGTPNRLKEMDHLKAKVDAGADYICTQLFFDNRDFWDFRERCELGGIRVPIVAGIMPITSRKGMTRMAELALGAKIPAALLRAVGRCADEDAVTRVGIHWATEQCRQLIDQGVAGIHFYTLNRSDATRQIYANLGVTDSAALRG